MLVRAAVVATLSASAILAWPGVGSAGGAASPTSAPEPWQPTRTEPFTAPAGKFCDFQLSMAVTYDDERSRVLARYPDGHASRQEFAGPLLVDFVNDATGQRIHRNLSGSGYADLRDDGTFERLTGRGPFGAGFQASDDYPRGQYVLTGVHVIGFDPDGTRHMLVDAGDEENVCQPLSP